MRHCDAESGEQLDPTRELTDLGKRQAKMMGKWLSRQTEKPELVIESNFKRSQQTAKRVAKQLDVPIIRAGQGAIDPDGTPEKAWEEIKRIGKEQNAKYVVAITHGPLTGSLLAYLTGSTLPQQFHFAHGAVAHFTTTSGKRGVMHWLVTPNTVSRDEDELENVTAGALGAIKAALRIADACLDLTGE